MFVEQKFLEIRHFLFSPYKDFIIVPINESAHWYLAIICFPNLTQPEYADVSTGATLTGSGKSTPAPEPEAGSSSGGTKESEGGKSAEKEVTTGKKTATKGGAKQICAKQ